MPPAEAAFNMVSETERTSVQNIDAFPDHHGQKNNAYNLTRLWESSFLELRQFRIPYWQFDEMGASLCKVKCCNIRPSMVRRVLQLIKMDNYCLNSARIFVAERTFQFY